MGEAGNAASSGDENIDWNHRQPSGEDTSDGETMKDLELKISSPSRPSAQQVSLLSRKDES